MLHRLAGDGLQARLLLAVALVVVLVWLLGLGWFVARVPL
jgi:hypothetical protein